MNNILIVGNGFDIYHGLPTRYSDFFFLASHWKEFKHLYDESIASGEKNEKIEVALDENRRLAEISLKDFARHKYIFNDEHIDYLEEHIETNVWIKYFLDTDLNGYNWVDFEAAIDDVLHSIEEFFTLVSDYMGHVLDDHLYAVKQTRFFIDLLKDSLGFTYYGVIKAPDVENHVLNDKRRQLLCVLQKELDELIECLRLYLVEFVLPIKCNVYSAQIKELNPVMLLNFNYTNTFQEIYGNVVEQYHSVHGDCIDGSMVLGISDDSFVNQLEYVYFIKYFQRIQKMTGNIYKKWFERPANGNEACPDNSCNVYIMGHSLAVTDKGILQDFFQNDRVRKITIFYRSQSSYEKLVINLIRMFGKDYVIENTGNKRIVFKGLIPGVPLPMET